MPKMTVNQKKAFLKAQILEGAKGNPAFLLILKALMPIILAALEALFNKEAE
jgi:hypothetical protein